MKVRQPTLDLIRRFLVDWAKTGEALGRQFPKVDPGKIDRHLNRPNSAHCGPLGRNSVVLKETPHDLAQLGQMAFDDLALGVAGVGLAIWKEGVRFDRTELRRRVGQQAIQVRERGYQAVLVVVVERHDPGA